LNLLLQGLGWSILPRSFVTPYLATQHLELLALANLSNSFPLCVDLVWSRLHPLGSAARTLIELITPNAQNKPR
jgi:DNA-binding transcriptional LysR family regulator